MNFNIPCNTLYALVAKAESCTSTKAPRACASGILISADKESGELTLTGSDGSKTVTVKTILNSANGSEMKKSGNVFTDGTLLREMLSAIPSGDTICFSAEGDSAQKVTVSWSNGHSTLYAFNQNDWAPYRPADKDEASLVGTVDAKWLVNAIGATAFSMAKDELRPTMTGLNLSFDEQGVKVVSTDAKTLSVRSLTIKEGEPAPKEFFNVNIPATALRALKIFLSGKDGAVEIDARAAGGVVLAIDGDEFAFIQVTGKFPQWKVLLSKFGEATGTIKAAKKDILGTLGRLKSSSDNKNLITMDITTGMLGGEVQWLSTNGMNKSMTKETSQCEYEGDAMKIAFAADTLEAAVRSVPCEDFSIIFHGADKAAFIVWDEEYSLEMIMPMKLQ